MSDIVYFKYGNTELSYLKNKDKKLAKVIDHVDLIQRPVMPDLFEALIKSIIGQQISTKAQETVWGRIVDFCGGVTPQSLNIPTDKIQGFGMTTKKAEYIKNIVDHVLDGRLDLNALNDMSDQEAIQTLTQFSGVGVWTAEMLLLFSMQRENIFSFGDLAIHRGLRMIYRHKKIDRERFNLYKKRFSPYGSVASLYIWAIASGRYDEYKDTI